MNPEPLQFPALVEFFGAYLHQDYSIYGSSPFAVARYAAREVESVFAFSVIGELSTLAQTPGGDAAIAATIKSLPPGVDLGYGGSVSQVLERMAREMSEELAKRVSSPGR